jgi:hypothetical protein
MINWFVRRVSSRKHDFAIGGEENPYCLRWWVIPRNRLFNIYLHKFLRDDEDRALHDHPWPNCSIPLVNGYMEVMFEWQPEGVVGRVLPPLVRLERKVGSITFRRAATAHRVEVMYGPAWSLFITGPVIRNWGFVCPKAWRPWQEFTKPGAYGEIGKGCE